MTVPFVGRAQAVLHVTVEVVVLKTSMMRVERLRVVEGFNAGGTGTVVGPGTVERQGVEGVDCAGGGIV